MDSETDRQPNDADETNGPPGDAEPESLALLEEDDSLATVEPADEVLRLDDAAVIDAPMDSKYRLPNAGRAFLWVLLLFGSQLIVGLVIGVVLVVTLMASGQIQMPRDLSSNIAEESWSIDRILVPLATLLTLGTALGVVILLFRKETARCMGLRGMTLTQTVLVLLSVLPCALLASEVTNCVSEVLPNISMDLFGDFAQESWWLVFVAACLFPGLGEELFFRGFLSRGLLAHHGPWLGTLITAFYFGAIHLHPIQACGAFALGLALQFVFLTTRSLWGAILLHTANNAVAFLAMRYGHLVPIPGFTTNSPTEPVAEEVPAIHYDELIKELNGHSSIAHTNPLLLLAATVAVAAIAWALLRTRTRWLRPDGTEWSRGFLSAEGPPPEVPVHVASGRLDEVTGSAVLLANIAFFAALFYDIQR
ncbi:MAG: lysostaphin resistance A-like protein [Planctomycetaceae bacterium]